MKQIVFKDDTLKQLRELYDKSIKGQWRIDETHYFGAVNENDKHVAMFNMFNSANEKTKVTRDNCIANMKLVCLIQNAVDDFFSKH